jgi:hypothetical protein
MGAPSGRSCVQRTNHFQIKLAFGIKQRVSLFQAQSADWDRADTAPFAVGDFENTRHGFLRRTIAVILHRTRILIFQLNAALFELRDQHADGFEQVERFEAPTTIGTLNSFTSCS